MVFVMLMKDAYFWLLLFFVNDFYLLFVKVVVGDFFLDVNIVAYYVDIKDLFLYGD